MDVSEETASGPKMTGKIEIGDVEYRVSAWDAVSKAGADYMSLSITVADEESPSPKSEKNHPEKPKRRFQPRAARGR